MMRKKHTQIASLIFCLFLFSSTIATAQKVSSQTFYRFDESLGEMIPDQEFRFYYDAFEQDTMQEGWIWEQERNSFQLSFRRQIVYSSFGERLAESTSFWEDAGIRISQKEWEYDEQERIIRFSEYRKNASETALSAFTRWEKEFDLQGCLVSQTYFQGGSVWRPIRRERYQYGPDCKPDSAFSEGYQNGVWTPMELTSYLYQDTLESRLESSWTGQNWTVDRRLKLIYDQVGNLLEWRAIYPDSSQFRQEYAFDAQGNRLYYAESQIATGDSIWTYFLAEQKVYDADSKVIGQSNLFDYDRDSQRFLGRNDRERFYDSEDRIILESSKLINLRLADSLVSETDFSFAYNDYCDGLPWWEETFREAAGTKKRLSRVEYGYVDAAPCQASSLGLTIAPNPVNEALSFYSDVLMEANTVISIYDMQQRLVFAGSVPYRTSHYIVSVESLTAGYYYLRVGAAERSLYAKFVKLP